MTIRLSVLFGTLTLGTSKHYHSINVQLIYFHQKLNGTLSTDPYVAIELLDIQVFSGSVDRGFCGDFLNRPLKTLPEMINLRSNFEIGQTSLVGTNRRKYVYINI